MQKEQLKQDEYVRFRILTEVSQQITSILEINDLLTRIVRLIQQTFNYYHVGIGLIEEDEVVYRVGAGALWDNPGFQFKPARLKVGSEGITGWVASTGQVALVLDVTQDSRYVWMQGSLTRSELTVPITVKGRIIGVLDAQSEQLDDFDQTDVEMLQSLSNQAGIAIENARLFAETQRLLEETEERNAELASINSMQLGLVSKLDIKEIYELVGDKLRAIFGVHGIVIYSFDHVRQLVIDEYAYEKGQRYEIPPQKMTPLHETIIRTGKTIFIQENARAFFEKVKHSMPVGEMPRSAIIVPFKSQNRVAGVIGLFDIDKDFAFTESDVRLIETLTNSMVVALESARLFAITQHRAEQFRVLAEVSQHIISLASVDELLNRIAHLVKDAFGYIHVGIGLVKGDQVISKAEVGAFEEAYHSISITLGEGIWGRVAQEGVSILSDHVNGDQGYKYMHSIGIHSHLCVPLKIKDKVIGVMSAASDHAEAFNQSDETILQTLANQVSVAIDNARLYEQARHLAVLEERQRLGRELHDSVTQSLYGISLYAQAATGKIAINQFDQAKKYLVDIQNTAQESLADMRLLIFELRPPILDDEGLILALQNRLLSVENRANIKTKIKSNLTIRLPSHIEEGLYQIAREALNNIIKHAHAKNILVCVQQVHKSVSMEISDDGIGFEPEKACKQGCLGLVNMKELALSQGWQLLIESNPGNGARIQVEIEQS
jgi:signal transduction histidine kinase